MQIIIITIIEILNNNNGMFYFNTFTLDQLNQKIAKQDGTLDESKIDQFHHDFHTWSF